MNASLRMNRRGPIQGRWLRMARKRLNGRQLETLRWISWGCPDGEQVGAGYKLTAQALQSRRLVRISRRHGVWTVEITAAGQYYLDHADYPPARAGTAAVTKAAGSSKSHSSAGPSTRASPPPQPYSKAQPRAKPPSQGDLLIAELVAAGGRIVVHQEYGPGVLLDGILDRLQVGRLSRTGSGDRQEPPGSRARPRSLPTAARDGRTTRSTSTAPSSGSSAPAVVASWCANNTSGGDPYNSHKILR